MYESDNLKDSPFNMALATLMRIDTILKQITLMSVEDNGHYQKTKYNLCRQLYINSVPLIKKKAHRKFLQDELDKIKPVKQITLDTAGQPTGERDYYNKELDYKLDRFVELCELALQKNGKYFMPSSQENDYF